MAETLISISRSRVARAFIFFQTCGSNDFAEPHTAAKVISMAGAPFAFSRADKGLTRFPPNVEQIKVEREGGCVWLMTRRNDVELRFPLTDDDCNHLASLLMNRA